MIHLPSSVQEVKEKKKRSRFGTGEKVCVLSVSDDICVFCLCGSAWLEVASSLTDWESLRSLKYAETQSFASELDWTKRYCHCYLAVELKVLQQVLDQPSFHSAQPYLQGLSRGFEGHNSKSLVPLNCRSSSPSKKLPRSSPFIVF